MMTEWNGWYPPKYCSNDLCQLVREFQVEAEGLGHHDGGRGIALAHTTILRWTELPTGIREALEQMLVPSADRGGWMRPI
jgi:hypothetical protein